MSRVIALLLFACLNVANVQGMDCSFGQSSNVFEKILQSCPQLLQPAEKAYCCLDLEKERTYCCDADEFALKTGLGIILPIIIAGAVVISLIVCCISCLCCSCCPWYRRRRQGTVYGKVQAPSVVHVIHAPTSIPQPTPNAPPYPANSTGDCYIGDQYQPPPQYTNEMYAKQPPYYPNYAQ